MFLQNIKRQISNYFTGVTLLRDSDNPCVPKIYLSDAGYAQSLDKIDDWENLGIGLILNVTSEDPADDELRQIYSDLGIDYLWLPIRDTFDPLPPHYLKHIINYVTNWSNLGNSNSIYDTPTMFHMDEFSVQQLLDDCVERPRPNILIHCSAGVNRSALVAAAILWYTTPNREKLWNTPEDLIEYMRTRQSEDRGIYLLTNSSFVQYLNENLRT